MHSQRVGPRTASGSRPSSSVSSVLPRGSFDSRSNRVMRRSVRSLASRATSSSRYRSGFHCPSRALAARSR